MFFQEDGIDDGRIFQKCKILFDAILFFVLDRKIGDQGKTTGL
jgi:hypothetical protein